MCTTHGTWPPPWWVSLKKKKKFDSIGVLKKSTFRLNSAGRIKLFGFQF
jgi:hypothetical protein